MGKLWGGRFQAETDALMAKSQRCLQCPNTLMPTCSLSSSLENPANTSLLFSSRVFAFSKSLIYLALTRLTTGALTFLNIL